MKSVLKWKLWKYWKNFLKINKIKKKKGEEFDEELTYKGSSISCKSMKNAIHLRKMMMFVSFRFHSIDNPIIFVELWKWKLAHSKEYSISMSCNLILWLIHRFCVKHITYFTNFFVSTLPPREIIFKFAILKFNITKK